MFSKSKMCSQNQRSLRPILTLNGCSLNQRFGLLNIWFTELYSMQRPIDNRRGPYDSTSRIHLQYEKRKYLWFSSPSCLCFYVLPEPPCSLGSSSSSHYCSSLPPSAPSSKHSPHIAHWVQTQTPLSRNSELEGGFGMMHWRDLLRKTGNGEVRKGRKLVSEH